MNKKTIYLVICSLVMIGILSLYITSYLHDKECKVSEECWAAEAQTEYDKAIEHTEQVKKEAIQNIKEARQVALNRFLELINRKLQVHVATKSQDTVRYQELINALEATKQELSELETSNPFIQIAQASSKLSPDQLWHTCNKDTEHYYSGGFSTTKQAYADHINRGGVAIDYVCKDRNLYVPDYNNQVMKYKLYQLQDYEADNLVGKAAKLIFLDEVGNELDKYWILGHINEFKKANGSTVQTGELFAIMGGTPNTNEGTTTGLHVHQELRIDGNPVAYPNINLIDVESMKLMSSQEDIDKIAKINNHIANYGRADHAKLDNTGHLWVEYQNKHKIKAEVAGCITQADTGWGGDIKDYTKFAHRLNNFGNVGVYGGNYKKFDTVEEGIEAIFIVLANNFPNSTTIKELDHSCSGVSPFYASSKNCNWVNNLSACINKMGYPSDINYTFKL